jgi:hypothetical protein
MLHSRAVPPPCRVKSVRQIEWEQDEDGWETRLRQLAVPVSAQGKPIRRAQRPLRKTVLQLAGKLTRRDALLLPRSLPGFTGTEREDLTCGKCSDLIGSRITAPTIRRRHPEGERLVIRCVCGALNLLVRDRGQAR